MPSSPKEHYQTAQILTAAPPRLRLLLIDGALRFANQAQRRWQEGCHEEAAAAVARCLEIVAELMASAATARSNTGRAVASLYAYVYRTLCEARRHRDPNRLEDALRVLRIEHETWQAVCERLGGSGGPRDDLMDANVDAAEAGKAVSAGQEPPPSMPVAARDRLRAAPAPRISLEA